MTIAQVSRKYGISADTLRYYERIGLIPAVHRTAGGIRDYTPEDCNWVELAKCMRAAGMQVEALAAYVALFQQGEETFQARKRLLIEQRDRLLERREEIQRGIDRLEGKIAGYERIFTPLERRMRADGAGIDPSSAE